MPKLLKSPRSIAALSDKELEINLGEGERIRRERDNERGREMGWKEGGR
jgi:hypothetical protein